MNTDNGYQEIDDSLDAQREMIRASLDAIASDVGMALRDAGFESFESSLDLDLDFVGDAAEFRALFFRKLAEVLEFESEKTGFAGEIPGAGVF